MFTPRGPVAADSHAKAILTFGVGQSEGPPVARRALELGRRPVVRHWTPNVFSPQELPKVDPVLAAVAETFRALRARRLSPL